MATAAPYGSWESPITAADYAAGSHPVAGGRFVDGPAGEQAWWLELRPAEGGRYAVRRAGAAGEPEDVLPAPWNARTRVHEYGGGAWLVTPRGELVFAEFSDQRLYKLDAPGGTPVPLTPPPPAPGAWRYADLRFGGGRVWCVRERHGADGAIVRDIATVPIDGTAAQDPDAVVSVVGGSHFLASFRLSPDLSRLAWIAWEHPQMPWDGTELRVAALDSSGAVAGEPTVLMGGVEESVLQPEWLDDSTLLACSDRSGFWNLYALAADASSAPVALAPMPADVGGPMWQLGSRWFSVLPQRRVLFVRTFGTDVLAVLDLATGSIGDIELPGHTTVVLGATSGSRVLLGTRGARIISGLRCLDLDTHELATLRIDAEDLPSPDLFSAARLMTFDSAGGREVHAVVYPPHNPEFVAPPGELPPYVAFVHGGPTGATVPQMSVLIAYFTSRGIGVVDVNYGGSTGYGREYRNRLRGQWGVVDVEDTVAAVRGLAAAGLADPARLAIEGGSAGGWTVLAALTTSDAFACGASYFGVAELVEFVKETHDFESRYVDGLIGPLPEALPLYGQRAPLSHVDGLSCPVLLLQGLDDPIVPPAQAERFRDALVRKGIPHAYRAYEGESHGFRRHETIVDSREAELSFYGQVMGFATPGIPAVEMWRPDAG